MTRLVLPAIWLLILIVGLPQLSETVYTPSLPDIAVALKTSESMVEHTLTIYLLGFAFGTLFWGRISDKFGRKPGVIGGLALFIIGCIGCYFSSTINELMISRLIQAFGGSIGSVLGQAICRDAFHGPALGKVYSSIGSALALFPALGPLMGGIIAQYFGWKNIFIFLILFAVILTMCIISRLPETHPIVNRRPLSLLNLATKMFKDKRVLAFGGIVAGCNGILFSYFAEGPFCLIKGLGLSPSQYGVSFIMIAVATMGGGIISVILHSRQHTSKEIMGYGLFLICLSTAILSVVTLVHYTLVVLPLHVMINVTLISQMIVSFGICMATSNALSLALVDYKYAIGTASSLFGFFYYSLVSVFTLGMGLLHNGTLLPMPLYFLGIGLLMLLISKTYVKK